MSKLKYQIVSPDGFSINTEGGFSSKKKGMEYFKTWKKRFEAQGYYSANYGRVHLLDLQDECQFVTI